MGGNNLENEKVLDDLDFFFFVNLIYSLQEEQNLCVVYFWIIVWLFFKELFFVQIFDFVINWIFNGSLFSFGGWDGNLVVICIDNIDF